MEIDNNPHDDIATVLNMATRDIAKKELKTAMSAGADAKKKAKAAKLRAKAARIRLQVDRYERKIRELHRKIADLERRAGILSGTNRR